MKLKPENYPEATSKEWIVTNNIGGYASSTIAGTNTRKYHGLLIAPLDPPLKRYLLLAKLEEKLGEFDLSTNKYINAIYPEGYRFLKKFELNPLPTFYFSTPSGDVKKTVFMVNGKNTTIVRYDVSARCKLEIRPLVNYRSIHAETRTDLLFKQTSEKNCTRIYLDGKPILYLSSDKAAYADSDFTDKWYRNFEFEREIERGESHLDNNFNPGVFFINCRGKTSFSIIASDRNYRFTGREIYAEKRRIKALCTFKKPFLNQLAIAADSFLVSKNRYSAIAGYHWFGDWGRDTMVSLPGLCLVTKKYKIAEKILKTYANNCKKGLIPNLFLSGKVYNSADASLWFINAVYEYLKYTENYEFVKDIWQTISDIIGYYIDGTDGIYADEDGLLITGEQLTWMDIKINDFVVTPRSGKAVEVNALWYNALRIADELGSELGEFPGPAADIVESSFQKFWNSEYLDDVIGDSTLRPNQILAVSLPFSPLKKQQQKKVVSVIQKELLTPYGLRTLSPKDSRYKKEYSGNRFDRDCAYHQGTVWPWLLGHFITAFLKVNPKKRTQAMEMIKPFKKHLEEAGLGTISEVFDGSEPHKPGGCISQAWSVAEILRVSVEYEL